MAVSWRIRKPTDGTAKFVVWQTPTSGDKMAPFDHPEQHLDRVWFCSDFDYYVALMDVQSVTIAHAAVPSGSTTLGPVTLNGQIVEHDNLLLDYSALGLTEVPRYKIAIGNVLVPNGYSVQNLSARCRQVSFYASTTQLRVKDVGVSSSSSLPAVNVTYNILLFKTPVADPDLPIFSARHGIMAQGKIRASEKHLRRSSTGDTPFDINLAPSIDINDGGVKWFTPDAGAVTFGSYGGSAVAPANIQCAIE